MASTSVAICDESPLLQSIGLTVIKENILQLTFFLLIEACLELHFANTQEPITVYHGLIVFSS
jgi:hypothetical protein